MYASASFRNTKKLNEKKTVLGNRLRHYAGIVSMGSLSDTPNPKPGLEASKPVMSEAALQE